ncbi:MAG: CehA/McbA family metallohydrolase [Planctomycetes bacterium]|nr:CehA/McbA family metallohydrolase [Planctomycetota bacterium]
MCVQNVIAVIPILSVLSVVASREGLAQTAANSQQESTAAMRKMWHLRISGQREWAEFPEKPDASRLALTFASKKNISEHTLRLRQQDVKQTWNVLVNGKRLGRLRNDENDMVVYFAVGAGVLIDGMNELRIEQDARRRRTPDDIRVGEITIVPRPVKDVLSQATLQIDVIDGNGGGNLPSRITIINENGALQTVGAVSNDHLAVRPGIVFTSTGRAKFGVPAGRYTVYAGRGFEYSVGSLKVVLKSGDSVKKTLRIRREVPTAGYVACDTHVHTLTHSGHGDATVLERMITIAAEGIELPIATDHNRHINHDSYARTAKVRKFFTPVIGNEVTTKTGHFNIFPVRDGAPVPDHRSPDWGVTLKRIFSTPGVKVAILNHARDVHGGTRPFGPELFNDAAGVNVRGWPMRFNAMEVINSGATQTDVMLLFRDWMALLNRGYDVTPVGSSDSHDVGRHFVGQGRTYIRCDDRNPGKIDVASAVKNFALGRVRVSYGLLAELVVGGEFTSGDLASVTGKTIRIDARVLGPHWVKADRIILFANGKPIRDVKIPTDVQKKLPTGVKWTGHWTLARPKHDVHLVAIALGPGVDGLFWKTAKAYQPRSIRWRARVIGCSGAVWLDVDGDGKKTAAREYASRLMQATGGDLKKLVKQLRNYDRAVAVQVASLYHKPGRTLPSPSSQLLKSAAPATRSGFRAYLDAWRRTQIAQIKRVR